MQTLSHKRILRIREEVRADSFDHAKAFRAVWAAALDKYRLAVIAPLICDRSVDYIKRVADD